MPSISLPELYSSLHTFILQTLPDNYDTRLANLLFMMRGLFLTRSATGSPRPQNAVTRQEVEQRQTF